MEKKSAPSIPAIPEKLYYKIGEVSQITGVEPYVLRYWESEFKIINPERTNSKQRLFRKRDLELILEVKKLLYKEKFTIAGAKKRLQEIKGLREHYIICGYGRIGRVISREFLKKPVPFVIVERGPEIFKTIDPGILCICGNATDDAVLVGAGFEQARRLVSVVSSDADNVYITLTAAGLRPDLYIVARPAPLSPCHRHVRPPGPRE